MIVGAGYLADANSSTLRFTDTCSLTVSSTKSMADPASSMLLHVRTSLALESPIARRIES
jgi:hypothetical protein